MTTELTHSIAINTFLPADKANAWVRMAEAKESLSEYLQTSDLKGQGILLEVKDSTDHLVIDKALTAYSSNIKQMDDTRLEFTNKVSGALIQPFIEKVKAAKESSEVIRLTNVSLQARKKIAEIERFKLHLNSEFTRVAEAYRTTLRNEISHQYRIALEAGSKEGYDQLKAALADLTLPEYNRFNPILLTPQELTEIANAAPALHKSEIVIQMQEEMDATFANFDRDLKEKVVTEVAPAPQPVVSAPALPAKPISKKSAVKVSYKIDTVETAEWAQAVIKAFLANWAACSALVKVSSYGNLSVKQMADALAKMAMEATVYEGLTLSTIEK